MLPTKLAMEPHIYDVETEVLVTKRSAMLTTPMITPTRVV